MREIVKPRLLVTSSPHAASPRTTRGIMLDVIIALMFPAVASVFIFGYRAAVRIVVCIVACVLFEWLSCKIMKKPAAIGDLSAVVTGMLLAFNIPAGLPIWQAVVGCFVAIVVVKQLFGGIGCNFVNPALAGRVVLALSFSTTMTTYAFPGGMDAVSSASPAGPDVLTSATPLNLIETGHAATLDLWRLFLGNYGGVLGETSALALTLACVYLVVRGVIKPIIPVSFIGSTLLFSWLFGCSAPIAAALSGGLFLGAVFMATDYATSPYTNWGKLVFGLGCGLLTALMRTFANTTEGVSYAILIMNLLVPYVNDLTRRKPYGVWDQKRLDRLAKKEHKAEARQLLAAQKADGLPAEATAEKPRKKQRPDADKKPIGMGEKRGGISAKPIIVLVAVCLVVSGLLAVVNDITAPVIEAAKQAELAQTLGTLLPDATRFIELDCDVPNVQAVYRDEGGTGYVVVSTGNGYKGPVTVTTAVGPDGAVLGISVDASGETPNVGSKTMLPDFTERFEGLTDSAGEVSVIAGATLSSRAVKDAVNAALQAYHAVQEG